MGYCTGGNLCVQRSGVSMNHIHHANLLRRAGLLSLTSHMKIMPQSPATARLHTFSVSLSPNFYIPAGRSPPQHTHMIACFIEKASCKVFTDKTALGTSATLYGLHERHKFSTWRVFSSMSDGGGSNVLILGEDNTCKTLPIPTTGSSKAKKPVVVVESPTKAKTIGKYLGPDYVVLPTYGHVRDLASRVGSVRPDEDYAMVWEVPEAAHTHINKIKQALKGADCLILASDPDREGEAIAWHVTELLKAEGVLKNKNPKVVRVTFHEITKGSVLRAMQDPRDICRTLVTAYLARRALDHLIGFALSPVLWRKLPGSKSAGRVQSVALRLVCEREREIEEFVPQESWTVEAYARLAQESEEHSLFPIKPTHVDGMKIEKFSFGVEDAKSLSQRLSNQPLKVSSVQRRSKRRNPPQPYITSTLQMDAQAKLGYGAVRTMTLAQKLYEGIKLENEQVTGLITYMRTDGLQLSSEAVKDICALVGQRYGDRYIPTEYRKFKSKVKNAQEAHEAIRPTDVYRLPSQLVDLLEKDALHLYTLIWKRTVACQMEQAVYEEAIANFVTEDGSIYLQGGSSILSSPGFLAAMEDFHGIKSTAVEVVEGESEREDIEIGKHTNIFSLKKDDVVIVQKAEAQQHFTRPPARFSEGLLVKAMEELGIGRPSTYASMLKTLESRSYVEIEHHRIIPKARGRMVATFLSHYFPKYIDYDFTARLEEQLDEVSGGQVEWKEVLRGFWPEFEKVVATSMNVRVSEVIDMLQGTLSSHCFKGLGINGHTCPSCGQGKLTLKLSRYGSGYFFGCNRYPDCSFKAQFLSDEHAHDKEENNERLKVLQKSDIVLGVDPDTHFEVRVRKGPYGYYIQSGEPGKQSRNFKIPRGVNSSDLTLEKAKELMQFPMLLGKHPDDGELVTLGIGNTSYYVRHRNMLASVPKGDAPHDVTLEQAVQLLKGKKVRHIGRKGQAVKAAAVSRTKKAVPLSTKKADDDDHKAKKVTNRSTEEVEGEGEVKAVRKPKTVKTEDEDDAKKAKLDSTEVLEAEAHVKRTGKSRSAKIEGEESDPKAKKVRKVRGTGAVEDISHNEKVRKQRTTQTELVEVESQVKSIRKTRIVKTDGRKRIVKTDGQESDPKAKVRKLRKAEVAEDEPKDGNIGKQRTTETEGNVTEASPDSLEDIKPRAKSLLRRKRNDPVVPDDKADNSMTRSINEVNFEADATVKNEANEDYVGKQKSRRKKAVLTGEFPEDEPDDNSIHKKVGGVVKTTSTDVGKSGNGSLKEGKPKAKRLQHQKKSRPVAAEENAIVAGDEDKSSEVKENRKPNLGRKKANLAVDKNVERGLEVEEPGLEIRNAVSNGRVKIPSRRKSTQAAV